MTTWLDQSIEFVRSHWMPISAFFGIPFVALAQQYRSLNIDFSYLHPIDVANFSFSLWGSFAVTYFGMFCFYFCAMRLTAILSGTHILRRSANFLLTGHVKDPKNIYRYIAITQHKVLEHQNSLQSAKVPYLLLITGAVLGLWVTIWRLDMLLFLQIPVSCWFLFWVQSLSSKSRSDIDLSLAKAHAVSSEKREIRIANYQRSIEKNKRKPKLPWAEKLLRTLTEMREFLSFEVNWRSTETKIIAGVCLLIVALDFGSAYATAVKQRPERLFKVNNREFCGKLFVKSFYGYHVSIDESKRFVFLPEVSAIESFPAKSGCRIDGVESV